MKQHEKNELLRSVDKVRRLIKEAGEAASGLAREILLLPADTSEDPIAPSPVARFIWSSPEEFVPSRAGHWGMLYTTNIPKGAYEFLSFEMDVTVGVQQARRHEGAWIGVGGNDKQILFLGFFDRQRIRFTHGFKPEHDHKNKVTVDFPFPRAVGDVIHIYYEFDLNKGRSSLTLRTGRTSVTRTSPTQAGLHSLAVDPSARRSILLNTSYQHETENEVPSYGWAYRNRVIRVR